MKPLQLTPENLEWLRREVDAGRTTLKAQADRFPVCYHKLQQHLRQYRKGVGRYS